MGKPIIMVSSVTYAMKGRDILFERGIRSYIRRSTRTSKKGCGYSLYVPEHADEAEQILREAQVHILGRMDEEEPA